MKQNESSVHQRCTLLMTILDWSPDSREAILSRMRSYPNRQDERGLESLAESMLQLIQNTPSEAAAVDAIASMPFPAPSSEAPR